MDAIKSRLEQEIGPIESLLPCHGGEISRAYRVEAQSGEKFFLKLNRRDLLDMFEAEAEGLDTLRERTAFRIPRVLDTLAIHDHSGILLEWIDTTEPDRKSWEQFWRCLGDMHSQENPTFGFVRDNFIGPLTQQNDADQDWIEFWIERRISPLVAQASDKGHIKQKDLFLFIQLFERVRQRLGNHAFRPRLLHGDLWKGNFLFDESGAPVLIDPAVYYGWPEMELSFMELFGGFDDTGREAYQPEGLADFLGDDFTPLWQIYPLLVHTILFGGLYQRRLMTAVSTSLEIL